MESPNKFKQCPVCKASVFSDMDTCYKCMYKFDGTETMEKVASVDATPTQRKDKEDELFTLFLIEFECFLRRFLADRVVDA